MAREPVALDEKGVRELLAGVELELGDERAKTASAETRVRQLEAALVSEQTRNTVQPAVVGGLIGTFVGALLAIVLGGK